jgi:CO dehydrogenase maturation factor
MFAAALGLKGQNVVAIDADPDANLAAALGMPPEKHPVFLAEMTDLIAERTGAKNAYGGYFRLNPRVEDIPDRYSRRVGNIRLLALGGVRGGGTGCICPATALVKALLTHLTLTSNDALIMDMEAGIEHLGRATTQSMDALVVVVDDGPWSVQTALRVERLARDIGISQLSAIVNRATEHTDLEAIRTALGEIPILGTVPEDKRFSQGIIQESDAQRLIPTVALSESLPHLIRILENLY